jgi:GTP1/Obg family GTP-binding protein
MEKETDTDKILRAIAGVHERVDEIADKMATKDDLADFKGEVVELISGKFAELRTEDIEPMKRDIASLKQTSDKVWNVFAPRLEYDDRLRIGKTQHRPWDAGFL